MGVTLNGIPVNQYPWARMADGDVCLVPRSHGTPQAILRRAQRINPLLRAHRYVDFIAIYHPRPFGKRVKLPNLPRAKRGRPKQPMSDRKRADRLNSRRRRARRAWHALQFMLS